MKMKLLLCALLVSAFSSVWAAPVGKITHLSGILSAKQADGTAKLLSVKSEVLEGDMLSTEADAYARIRFADGGEVVLRPNSQLKVDKYSYDEAKPQSDNIFMSMLKGGLRAVTGAIGKRNQGKISYQTPTATIGIRGTHWGMLLCNGDCGGIPTASGQPPADGLHVDVQTGTVSISNSAGTFTFEAGKFAYVPDANRPPELVPPERAIRVTMPGSVAVNRGTGTGIGSDSAADCIAE
ncbi:MAG: FecR family protein [Rhodocyclaceae bacterium]|nr:FecR family protein [Rhodocyclaceae bacterium]MDZ4215666.1 FecR family protein [Rhodocyclaceae bacterium]